uniref:TOD1/MUCI70 glycosyltransferase-like domain-containing protein n=1 Tax=Aegilops tauschii subsp. strangulata TaxID=200361 RepID=A0A453PK49_AEGTS
RNRADDMGREQPKEKRTGGDFAAATRRSGASAALGHMVEHRLPTTGLPPAAGPRRHSRRPRRRCRLLLPPTFALALLSLAYLSFSSHASLPFHPIHQGPMNRENVGKGMDKRDKRNTTVKENISMTIDKSEPFIKGRKKKSYGPCEIEFLPSVDNLVEPADYNNFTQFLLKYILTEGHLIGNGIFEPLFAGHQSLQEREETYYAKNQSLHCGFVEGPEGYPSSGFDLDEHDRAYMATCRVVVSSCIFGGSDYLRRPTKSRDTSLMKMDPLVFGELL